MATESDSPPPIDIARRLRQTRSDMLGTDDEPHYWDCQDAAAEIERLRLAIRRLAEQDATLSVQGGHVTVTMDATLTDAEREAILYCVSCAQDYRDTLDGSEERATQMIEAAMRLAMPNVGPAPVERGGATSVTDVGGAGPILTDAEREAIEMAIRRERGEWYGNPDYTRAITLRGLLERMRDRAVEGRETVHWSRHPAVCRKVTRRVSPGSMLLGSAGWHRPHTH